MNLLGTPIFLSWLTNELRNIAITNFTSVLATNKTNEQAYLNRASLNSQATNYVAASNDYESAISLNTKDFEPLNGEAWLLATCPDPSIRNGAKAYELASNACVLTGWTNWYCLGTLAGAYAERGDFTNAAIYQKKSISICNGDDTQKTNGLHYLHLYESNKPSRDPESPAEESKGK
jgi:serine/threonine-protein kinase